MSKRSRKAHRMQRGLFGATHGMSVIWPAPFDYHSAIMDFFRWVNGQ